MQEEDKHSTDPSGDETTIEFMAVWKKEDGNSGFDAPAPLLKREIKTGPDGPVIIATYEDGTILEIAGSSDGSFIFSSNRSWKKDPVTGRMKRVI